MVPLDADGISLPSDWYLQVGGEAARMLRGEIPLQGSLPISPLPASRTVRGIYLRNNGGMV
jgi:hypothetical protein